MLKNLSIKKLITLTFIFALILIFIAILQTSEITKAETAPSSALNSTEINADGAILMEASSGRVLWEKNGKKPLPMASTTKIMTAIITLESGRDLQEQVTVSQKAAQAPKVRLGLSTGETVKLIDLLHALMLESSNDAAIAIAEHISGSEEAFCAEMTQKAKEIGAMDTIFETPNGLDKGNHHSTAYDMALIGRYALNNQQFMDIVNAQSREIVSSNTVYYVQNKNRLLSSYDGANGMKTGFTNKAGNCFVGSAKRGDMQLISVVLASGWGNEGREKKWTDTKKILDYGFENYEITEVITGNEILGEFNILHSRTPILEYKYSKNLIAPLNKTNKEQIDVKISVPQEIEAPISDGEKLGTAEVYISGQLYDTIDLVVVGDAERHDLSTSTRKVVKNWFKLGTSNDIEIKY